MKLWFSAVSNDTRSEPAPLPAPTNQEVPDGEFLGLRPAVSSGGQVVAAHLHPGKGTGYKHLWLNRLPARDGGVWTGAEDITAELENVRVGHGGSASLPLMAADSNDRVHALFLFGDDMTKSMYDALFRPGEKPSPVEEPSGTSKPIKLVVNPDGRALAIWSKPMTGDAMELEGYQPWSELITLRPAEKREVVAPALRPLTEPRPQPTAVAPAAQTTTVSLQPAAATRRRERTREQTNYHAIIGYSVVGLGVVGVSIAGYLGLRALHFMSERDKLCPGGTCALQTTDAARMEHADRVARDFAAAFNWTGALSLLTLGVGATLILTAPREREVALALGWGTVQLSGALPQ